MLFAIWASLALTPLLVPSLPSLSECIFSYWRKFTKEQIFCDYLVNDTQKYTKPVVVIYESISLIIIFDSAITSIVQSPDNLNSYNGFHAFHHDWPSGQRCIEQDIFQQTKIIPKDLQLMFTFKFIFFFFYYYYTLNYAYKWNKWSFLKQN